MEQDFLIHNTIARHLAGIVFTIFFYFLPVAIVKKRFPPNENIGLFGKFIYITLISVPTVTLSTYIRTFLMDEIPMFGGRIVWFMFYYFYLFGIERDLEKINISKQGKPDMRVDYDRLYAEMDEAECKKNENNDKESHN